MNAASPQNKKFPSTDQQKASIESHSPCLFLSVEMSGALFIIFHPSAACDHPPDEPPPAELATGTVHPWPFLMQYEDAVGREQGDFAAVVRAHRGTLLYAIGLPTQVELVDRLDQVPFALVTSSGHSY